MERLTSKEALDRLFGGISDYAKQCNKELTSFEIEWLDTIYKDLEILNIIIKKCVDMSWLVYALNSTSSIEKALNVYNDKNAGNIPLTLEEISILKRLLENRKELN